MLPGKTLVMLLYHSSALSRAGKVTRKNVDLTFYVAFSVEVQLIGCYLATQAYIFKKGLK